MKKYFLIFIATIVALLSCEKTPEEIPVTSVSINQPSAEMLIGETVQLKATVSPSDATDKTVSWASSKQSVATVSETGLVTAIAEGVSTITATAGGKFASCVVTVSKGAVDVSSVTLNKAALALIKGESETLVATVNPADATDKTVTWTSSSAGVATVDANGKVTAIANGTSTITAKAGNIQATCAVTVTVPIESISINKTELSLIKGQSETLIATVTPEDATESTVSWTSSNTSVAAVGSSGKVTAVGGGSAAITAKVGGKEAVCSVIVTVPVASINLDQNSVSINEGESVTLVATVTPDDATDKTVKWSSSNETIATVEQNGKVTALKAGNAEIQAEADGKTARCSVVVINPNNIVFADKKLKSALVNAFDSDGDGELSYEEAASVTSSQRLKNSFGAFSDYYYYKSFDEFQYFTGITEMQEAMFLSWGAMASIILPNSIKSISKECFRYCDNLTSFTIPDSVVSIGTGAFMSCDKLETIVLPDGLKTISWWAFQSCNSLKTITFPDSVTGIDREAFLNCKQLTTVTLPKSLHDISKGLFRGCINLSSVSIPENLSWIGESAFSNCPKLTAIDLPEGLLEIGESAFKSCGLTSVTIPGSITSIGESAFNDCVSLESITIMAETVPTGGSKMFESTNNCPIYVPSNSVEAYKSATYWRTYAERIQAIP